MNTHDEVYDEFIDALLCGKVTANDDVNGPIRTVEPVIDSETCENDEMCKMIMYYYLLK